MDNALEQGGVSPLLEVRRSVDDAIAQAQKVVEALEGFVASEATRAQGSAVAELLRRLIENAREYASESEIERIGRLMTRALWLAHAVPSPAARELPDEELLDRLRELVEKVDHRIVSLEAKNVDLKEPSNETMMAVLGLGGLALIAWWAFQ